jgi:hypothetical protein
MENCWVCCGSGIRETGRPVDDPKNVCENCNGTGTERELPDTHHLIVVLHPKHLVEWYGYGCEFGMPYSTRDEAIAEMNRLKRDWTSTLVLLCEVGLEPEGDHAIETWIKVCF